MQQFQFITLSLLLIVSSSVFIIGIISFVMSIYLSLFTHFMFIPMLKIKYHNLWMWQTSIDIFNIFSIKGGAINTLRFYKLLYNPPESIKNIPEYFALKQEPLFK